MIVSYRDETFLGGEDRQDSSSNMPMWWNMLQAFLVLLKFQLFSFLFEEGALKTLHTMSLTSSEKSPW